MLRSRFLLPDLLQDLRLQGTRWAIASLLLHTICGCADDPTYFSSSTSSTPATTAASLQAQQAAALVGAKVIFNTSNFSTLINPDTSTSCSGDAKIYYDPFAALGTSAQPSPLPANVLNETVTIQPTFINNIGVDITDASSQSSINLSYSCSFGSSTYPSNLCAVFDSSGYSFYDKSSQIGIPIQAYNTGYYTVFDQACGGAGPINSQDSTQSKLLVGGIYFDINRSALQPQENLLLHLAFIPLGVNNGIPDIMNNNPGLLAPGPYENAIIQVHLVRTGETASAIQSTFQPRILTYGATQEYPQIAQDLAIVTPPLGQLREEQILIPLGLDPTIDRIHVQRYSGNIIFVEARLFRTQSP